DHVYQPQDHTQNGAPIWATAGVSFDNSGNVYVATGNGFTFGNAPCTNVSWDHGNSVIKLDPSLTNELAHFTPTNWCELNFSDSDVGSIAPALVSSGDVFQSGKSGGGWLLNSSLSLLD